MKNAFALLLFAVSLEAQVSTMLYLRGNPPSGVGGACNTYDFGYISPTIGTVTCQNNVWTAGTVTSVLYPAADSTTAVQIDKANASTVVVDVDTTNARVGINNTAPAQALDVTGSGKFSGTVITPVVAPASDSTTAVKVTKADGSTAVVTVDTTNTRVGVGKTPTTTLDVNGTVAASTQVTTPIVAPSADSTTAIKITKADGSTAIATIDSTNSQVGINQAPQSSTALSVLANTSSSADTTAALYIEGPTQAILAFKNTGGNRLSTRWDGTTYSWRMSGTDVGNIASTGINLGPNTYRMASSVGTTADTGLSRSAAGTVAIGNGSAGDFSGTIKAATLSVTNPVSVANGGTNNASPGFATQTDGATVTWALGSALLQAGSLTFTTHGGSRTLNITNPVSGGSYVLKLVQDGTGGEGLTLGTGCTWKVSGGGAGAVSLSAGANAVDVLAFVYDGTNCLATLTKNFN